MSDERACDDETNNGKGGGGKGWLKQPRGGGGGGSLRRPLEVPRHAAARRGGSGLPAPPLLLPVAATPPLPLPSFSSCGFSPAGLFAESRRLLEPGSAHLRVRHGSACERRGRLRHFRLRHYVPGSWLPSSANAFFEQGFRCGGLETENSKIGNLDGISTSSSFFFGVRRMRMHERGGGGVVPMWSGGRQLAARSPERGKCKA